MRLHPVPLLLCAVIFGSLFPTPSLAREIREGDTRKEVLWELGNPKGSLVFGGEETLYYDRGEIRLKDGKVVSSEFISVEAFNRQEAARRLEETRLRATQQRLREEHLAKARREKERLLNDPAFTNAAPEEQVAQWESFRESYPELPEDETVEADIEKKRETIRDIAEAEEDQEEPEVAAPPQPPPPKLSGSKSKKARRAGKGPPVERPSFLSDQKVFD